MKIIQSRVEQFLYIVLLAVFCALLAGILVFANRYHALSIEVGNLKRDINSRQTTEQGIKNGTDTVICMLKVPVSERTDNKAEACRKATSAPAKPGSLNVAAPQPQSKVFVSSPQPNNAPSGGNKQVNNNPSDNDGVVINLPLLPKIHIGSPL